MELFLIICSLLTVVVAQNPTITCNYFLYLDDDVDTYSCDLSINNPTGFNDFTQIGGIHLEGFTNADVRIVGQPLGGRSRTSVVPHIICATFPNVVRIALIDFQLARVDDDSFNGCNQATELSLSSNAITSISANAFANLPDLTYINLDQNLLTSLPENVFASQRNLTYLSLSTNLFEDFSASLFRPLENLENLYIGWNRLSSIGNQWFSTMANLNYLYLGSNTITTLSPESFVGLEQLRNLDLAYNAINEINSGTFAPLQNLSYLVLYNNVLTELRADGFIGLETLGTLDISDNPIGIIHEGAFRGLENLATLNMARCSLRQLQMNNFEDLGNLTTLSLYQNEIEELPAGVFVPLSNLNTIHLGFNRLKTVRRNSFGTLTALETFELQENVVNAFDRSIIDDAVNLDTLYFSRNICANNHFYNFRISREVFLTMLGRCFTNLGYLIDTVTEGDDEFSFFNARLPGIFFRVNADSEIHIALTPFDFTWTPIIEVFIGTANNTRSAIRLNEDTFVVTVPTPNIIRRNQANDFRISWVDHNVLVFSGNDVYPFMGFTMQDFYPVNFIGLKAVENRATWTIQPIDW
ncbi:hypothetical protein HA402_003326 [Bradysia odoriphaga]|nr:hypothetical protein HA402_003326 [Bradysia odoriphaga]